MLSKYLHNVVDTVLSKSELVHRYMNLHKFGKAKNLIDYQIKRFKYHYEENSIDIVMGYKDKQATLKTDVHDF